MKQSRNQKIATDNLIESDGKNLENQSEIILFSNDTKKVIELLAGKKFEDVGSLLKDRLGISTEDLKGLGEKDYYLLLLKIFPSRYSTLPKNLKSDIEIGKVVVEAMFEDKIDVDEIYSFIEKNYRGPDKENLINYFENNVFHKETKFSKRLNDTLNNLKITNPEFYSKLKSKKAIISADKNTFINRNFVAEFVVLLKNNTNYQELDFSLKEKERLNILLSTLGLKDELLGNEEWFVISTMLNLIFIEEEKTFNSEKSKEEKKENTKKQEEKKTKKEKIEKKKKVSDKGLTTVESNSKTTSFVDYGSSRYSIVSSGSSYYVKTNFGEPLKLSTTESEKFNQKTFLNFMKFYELMHELGLGFLWKNKYRDSFKSLLSRYIDFDETKGEGITEEKTLEVLNVIGKNVGVPEQEIPSSDSENKTMIRCFRDIEDARRVFSEILSTGMIKKIRDGKVEYEDCSSFSAPPVEIYLYRNGYLDMENGGLNSNKWQNYSR